MAPNELIAKFKVGKGMFDLSNQNKRDFGILEIRPIFLEKPFEVKDELDIELERIFSIFLTGESNFRKTLQNLERTELFEYVEPRYLGKLAYTPNDPSFSGQNAVKLIEADKAWDVTKGSSNVIVAIVDAGIDTAHIDLKGQHQFNTADPIDGVDNDNNGYTDDYLGWNFGANNNNPKYSSEDHGVKMSGVIAATPDNSVGFAGIVFNCKILGVKVTNSSNQVAFGYEGIKYSADRGCKIINCSWNIKSYSKFGEEMVEYANQRGALVVAANGNEGNDDLNYPASYKNVLAVSNTDLNDNRVSNSNIGFYTDLSAPGLNVLTLKPINNYERTSGTSMSCAVVSGVAALVASQHPTYNGLDILNTLKASGDPLYANGKNSFYENKLGVGRVNAFSAVNYAGSYTELDSISFSDKDGGAIEQGDTVAVVSYLANYLAQASNVNVELKSKNSYSVLVNRVWNAGTLAKNAIKNNTTQPFTVKLGGAIPQNEILEFEIEIQTLTDTNSYGFSFVVNPTYRDITVNKLHTTIGSRGTYGYYEYPQKKGLGVVLDGGEQLLYEGGLLIGQGVEGNSTVMDRIRGIRDVEQTDFRAVTNLHPTVDNSSNQGYFNTFDDNNSKSPINVSVSQKTRAWTSSAHQNYVVIDYSLTSNNNSDLTDIYVGLFADWDIGNSEKNGAEYNGQLYLAYTYAKEGSPMYAGMQLLTEYDEWRCYSIDHVIGGEGGIDITDNDVFSKEEKFFTLSNFRENAGEGEEGADVLQMLSSGPHNIRAGDSLTISFAVHAASSKDQLFKQADSAFFKQNGELPMNVELKELKSIEVYPNPSAGKYIVSGLDLTSNPTIVVSNAVGAEVEAKMQELSNGVSIEFVEPQPGIYFISINQSVFRAIVQ